MRSVIFFLLFLAAALGLYAQGTAALSGPAAAANITTTEAQALVDALGQSERHFWSTYYLGMAPLAAALATLSLLFNLRSLAFLFLIFYGAIVLATPYYIPEAFKSLFGIATVVAGVVGLLMRLLQLGQAPRRTVEARAASEDNTEKA